MNHKLTEIRYVWRSGVLFKIIAVNREDETELQAWHDWEARRSRGSRK
jgi:hypothetical protein